MHIFPHTIRIEVQDDECYPLEYMENSKLTAFVAQKLAEGTKADELKQQLVLVGWSEEEALQAISLGLVDNGVPSPLRIMSGQGRLSSTVEVIINLFSFILLGGVATALMVLYYQIINHYFPDALAGGYGYSDVSSSTIHYSIAALIVGFPIYYVSINMWFKRYREDDAKTESKLTKWLTYLVLLVAAVTIVGDLVTALFYFLQGEVTMRFFLKALVILGVFGMIFGFYFLERKKVQYKKDIPRRTFQMYGYTVSIFVVIGIIFGFIAGGSPKTERMRGFDVTRAQDLNSLANCIASYGTDRKSLPATLESLSESTQYSYCGGKSDPETGKAYGYHILTASEKINGVTQGKFELCAMFSLSATKESVTRDVYSSYADKWSIHPMGESCDSEVVTLDRADMRLLPTSPALPVMVK